LWSSINTFFCSIKLCIHWYDNKIWFLRFKMKSKSTPDLNFIATYLLIIKNTVQVVLIRWNDFHRWSEGGLCSLNVWMRTYLVWTRLCDPIVYKEKHNNMSQQTWARYLPLQHRHSLIAFKLWIICDFKKRAKLGKIWNLYTRKDGGEGGIWRKLLFPQSNLNHLLLKESQHTVLSSDWKQGTTDFATDYSVQMACTNCIESQAYLVRWGIWTAPSISSRPLASWYKHPGRRMKMLQE
jgi:hypothetical protein